MCVAVENHIIEMSFSEIWLWGLSWLKSIDLLRSILSSALTHFQITSLFRLIDRRKCKPMNLLCSWLPDPQVDAKFSSLDQYKLSLIWQYSFGIGLIRLSTRWPTTHNFFFNLNIYLIYSKNYLKISDFVPRLGNPDLLFIIEKLIQKNLGQPSSSFLRYFCFSL